MLKYMTLEISTPLAQALWDGSRKHTTMGSPVGNVPLAAAFGLLHGYGIDKQELTVWPELVISWVETWFDAADLDAYLKTDGKMYPGAIDIRKDPAIREFTDTMLKIYRLIKSL
jgi:hypothetical protein